MVAGAISAQVGMNTDTPKVTLDVVASKTDGSTAEGILAPRLTGDELKSADGQYDLPQDGALIYATSAVGTASTKTANVKKAGYYYYDAPNGVWVAVGAGNDKWFYMPSFNLPITATGTGLNYDLYAEYARQFSQVGNTQFVSSNGSATYVETIYAATDLEYYVTAYTGSVIKVNSISTSGVMNYNVLSTTIPEGSFINVIFKVK